MGFLICLARSLGYSLLIGMVISTFVMPSAFGLSEKQKRLYHENINYFDIDTGECTGSTNLTGNDNEEKIWNFF